MRYHWARRVTAIATAWTLLAGGLAQAQSAENVLLVINQSSRTSIRVGDHYARRRAIPYENLVYLNVSPDEEISRTDFDQHIARPITAWLTLNQANDRILYIVLTKGVPLRITGTAGFAGTLASVDSELTLLYRELTGRPVAPFGRVSNPYFLGTSQISDASLFTHETNDIFLVSRLDRFTVDDVIALIDRGVDPVRDGVILLDQTTAWKARGNDWLRVAADRLTRRGFEHQVVLDSGSTVLQGDTDVLGYYSWGSNDPAIQSRRLNLGFVPGALAAMFVSTDARTFNEPPLDWELGTWEVRNTHFAGSPQSLAGDLIRAGATGVAGHVAESYLDAAVRPEILFPAYLSGFNLIESFYLAIPYLSWQTVVVGDPLCAPFQQDISAARTGSRWDGFANRAGSSPRGAWRWNVQGSLRGLALQFLVALVAILMSPRRSLWSSEG